MRRPLSPFGAPQRSRRSAPPASPQPRKRRQEERQLGAEATASRGLGLDAVQIRLVIEVVPIVVETQGAAREILGEIGRRVARVDGESAVLVRRPDGYWLEPVRNGEPVLHNDSRVTGPRRLASGDTLKVGELELEFVQGG